MCGVRLFPALNTVRPAVLKCMLLCVVCPVGTHPAPTVAQTGPTARAGAEEAAATKVNAAIVEAVIRDLFIISVSPLYVVEK